MRTPPLNALKAFEAVVRRGGLTSAAEELFVTPTAVGRHIKKLEDYLSIELFERKNGRLVPTTAGKRYAKSLHKSFSGIAEATNELRGSSGRHHLVIKAYTGLLVHWLMPRLGYFQREYPDIDLNIESGFSSADFSLDRIDIEIRYGRGNWPNLKTYKLFDDELVPFCAPELAGKLMHIHPRKWPQDISLIVHSRRPDDWSSWLESQGMEFTLRQRRITFEDLLMVYRAAYDGLGVAITQRRYVEADAEKGTLAYVSDAILKRGFGYYAICPPEVAENEAAQSFINWLLRESKPSMEATSAAI